MEQAANDRVQRLHDRNRAVIELIRSTVSVSEDDIRQNLGNQKPEFIEGFFSTLRFVMAGSDTEGLRYGTIGPPERHCLTWRENGAELDAQIEKVFRSVQEQLHRTQSGLLHDAMKAMLPAAVFIGFTGTPLLKSDKQRSIEVFGGYIHTCKFNEAVTHREDDWRTVNAKMKTRKLRPAIKPALSAPGG